MPCSGALKRPLRIIIQSIGDLDHHPQLSPPIHQIGSHITARASPASDWTGGGRQVRCISQSVGSAWRRPKLRCPGHAVSTARAETVSRPYATTSTSAQRSEDDITQYDTHSFQSVDHAAGANEVQNHDRRERGVPATKEQMRRLHRVDRNVTEPPIRSETLPEEAEFQYQPLDSVLDTIHESEVDSHTVDKPIPALYDAVRESEEKLDTRYLEKTYANSQAAADRRTKGWERQQQRRPHHSEDWRKVLFLLDKNTPSGQKIFEKKVEVFRFPSNIAATFKFAATTTILEIMQRTNCHVQICQEVDSNAVQGASSADRLFTSVTLLGTKLERRAAIDILPEYLLTLPLKDKLPEGEVETEDLSHFEIEQLANTINTLTESTPRSDLSIRAVWAMARRPHSHEIGNLFRRPRLESMSEMTDYVRRLCAKVPPLTKRKLLPDQRFTSEGRTDHVGIVTRELLSLVSDPHLVRYFSSAAVDCMAEYWGHHDETRAFREMSWSLEQHGYALTTSNFNFALATAAKRGDVHNFHFVLALMLRRGRTPDATTWVHFHKLMCVRFPSHAWIVASRMHSKGVLADPGAAHDIVRNFVALDLQEHLTLGESKLKRFFEHEDHKLSNFYGLKDFNWLRPDVAKIMVRTLLAEGRVEDAFQVLYEMWSRDEHAVITIHVLNAFLRSALHAEDPYAAIVYVRHFRVGHPGSMIPTAATYMTLFEIAWNCKCYNMLRVIWRYACTSGQAVYNMLFTVMRSFRRVHPPGTKEEDLSREQLWNYWAGKFAVGVTDGLKCDTTKKITPSEPSSPETAVPWRRVDTLSGPGISTARSDSATETKGFQAVKCDGDANLMPRVVRLALSQRERTMLRYEVAARDPACIIEKHPNFYCLRGEQDEALQTMFGEDLDEVQSCKPTRPLESILEDAWRIDMQWAKKTPKTSKKLDEGAFAEMMVQGIFVPMEVGDWTRNTRPWEVPWLKGPAGQR